MTTADNPQILSLETVRTVWAIEIKDIDARVIGGQDPNSRLNKAEEAYVNIERKTGVEKSTQNMLLAGIGNLTGTTGLIMAGIALAGGLDMFDNQKTLKNAEITEKLLALTDRPISSVDWDTLSSLIKNIESWLIPILSKRIESLSEILQINSNDLAKERLETYVKAVEELEAALTILKGYEKEFDERWTLELESYNKGVHELLEAYSTEKRRLALANEALLIDKAEFISRSREIEDIYASKTCATFSCKNVSASGSLYCFHHKCFSSSGCIKSVLKDLHYCKEHVRDMADVELRLPSVKHDNSKAVRSSGEISTGESGCFNVIVGILVVSFVGMFVFVLASIK